MCGAAESSFLGGCSLGCYTTIQKNKGGGAWYLLLSVMEAAKMPTELVGRCQRF